MDVWNMKTYDIEHVLSFGAKQNNAKHCETRKCLWKCL